MPAGPRRDKIECRFCGCGQSTIDDTDIRVVSWGGIKRTVVKRYRKCRYCKMRFTTIETYEDENNPDQPEVFIPPPILPPKKAPLQASKRRAKSTDEELRNPYVENLAAKKPPKT